jgi:hypothetical protein
MRATFDGIVLSAGSFSADAPYLATFRISGQQTNQIRRPARAEWIRPIARGHRSHVIEMIFRPPPAADYDAAAEALALYFAELPQQGDLVILSGSRERTFADACVENFSPPERTGISNEFPVRFLAGAVTYRILSPLARMDARYPNIITVTGLTGGTTNLDGLQTSDVDAGRMVDFYLNVGGFLQPHRWVLTAWTDEAENADDGRVKPDDFHSTENPKIWRRLL